MRRIYLDCAATTPLDPKVRAAMDAAPFGNPSSLHSVGQEASRALFHARRTIAAALAPHDPRGFAHLVFTGSATEANNLALRGAVNAYRSPTSSPTYRIIISGIEHESVRETARELQMQGIEVIVLPVNKEGVVNLRALTAALAPQTVVLSVMYANHEVGTIQPIARIAQLIRNLKLRIGNSAHAAYPLLHTDAVQAFQYLTCNPAPLGVDLLTISAHKIYGPKGVAALYVRDPRLLTPSITGGGQEQGLRSGTENVAGIIGFAEAARSAAAMRKNESQRVARLRNYFWRKLRAATPELKLNGPSLESSLRLPNNLNIWFPGAPAQELLVALDLAGIAASSGSACASSAATPSSVLRAMGYSLRRAAESIRLTLGRMTTARDVEAAARVIKKVYAKIRKNKK